MKKFDITALGEILVDYTPMPKSKTGMAVFEQNPGGAPANVLACATTLGLSTAFIGKVGDDTQGEFLINTLNSAGIYSKSVIVDKNFFTTLAFVSLSDTGERSFAFARKPGADTQLSFDEVDFDVLKNTNIFHIGSLSLTHNPARGTTIKALEFAKNNGAIISYDPNYRALLWTDELTASNEMKSVLKYVDILKISDEETHLLTPYKQPEKAAQYLINAGIPVLAVTLGENGCLVANKEGFKIIPSFKADVVDTTGAGDSFWGAFLYNLVQSAKKPCDLTLTELETFAKFSNATASLRVRKRGAIPAMPKLEEVNTLL